MCESTSVTTACRAPAAATPQGVSVRLACGGNICRSLQAVAQKGPQLLVGAKALRASRDEVIAPARPDQSPTAPRESWGVWQAARLDMGARPSTRGPLSTGLRFDSDGEPLTAAAGTGAARDLRTRATFVREFARRFVFGRSASNGFSRRVAAGSG
jgi:hypothetical protein